MTMTLSKSVQQASHVRDGVDKLGEVPHGDGSEVRRAAVRQPPVGAAHARLVLLAHQLPVRKSLRAVH